MSNRKERRAAQKAARSNPSSAGPGTPSALTAAMRLYQARRFAEAERLCEQHLTIVPRDPKAIYLLGMIAIETDRLDRAESCLEDALAQCASEPAFHNGLALLRARQERFAEASASHARALELDPRDVGALLGRAQALSALGDFIAAERAARRAAELAPGAPLVARVLANVLGSLHRHDEATSAYRALITLAPADAEAHLGLGDALAEQGKLEEAAACCARALAFDPDHARARLKLVELLCDLGRSREAWSCALAGINRAPGAPEARAAFARALVRAMPDGHDPDAVRGLEHCFEAGDLDPDELAKPAAYQLRAKYDLDAAPRHAGAEAVDRLLRDRKLPAVLSDPLLHHLLRKAVNRDTVLESFLTAARSALFVANGLPAAAIPFLAVLALQAFNNAYVFAVSEEERIQLTPLKAALEAELRLGIHPSPEQEVNLLRYALYGPLVSLDGAAVLREHGERDWSADFRAVLTRTVTEPMEERALARSMPMLGTIEDPTSLEVKAQYEEHPYPRWFWLSRPPREHLASRLRWKFPHAALPDFLDESLEILIAGGGTGIQPFDTALSFRDVNVLSVDLSRASLAYAQRMAAKLGIANVRFLQADLLHLDELERQFPIIEATGVLHHLEDPMAGWRVLVSLLRPGGLMRIGLYSAIARVEVTAARQRIAALGLKAIAEDIRWFRERLLFGKEAAEFPRLALSKDIHNLNGCRDLLFHAREHSFTLPQVQAMLMQLGLEFLGFDDLTPAIIRYYREAYPGDPAMTDLANWAEFEASHPDAFALYMFWCAKRRAA